MRKLQDKVAIITGASRGIGRGIAEVFARHGAQLMLSARNAEQLTSETMQLRTAGTQVELVAGDVADERIVDLLFERTLAAYGRIDLVVNNAGAFDGGPLDAFS